MLLPWLVQTNPTGAGFELAPACAFCNDGKDTTATDAAGNRTACAGCAADVQGIDSDLYQIRAYLQSAVVFGRCRLMESGPAATRRLKQFAMKYYPEEQLADREIAASGRAAQMFEITIEHVSGKEVQEK